MYWHHIDYVFLFFFAFVLQGNLLVRSYPPLCKSKGMRWHHPDYVFLFDYVFVFDFVFVFVLQGNLLVRS